MKSILKLLCGITTLKFNAILSHFVAKPIHIRSPKSYPSSRFEISVNRLKWTQKYKQIVIMCKQHIVFTLILKQHVLPRVYKY